MVSELNKTNALNCLKIGDEINTIVFISLHDIIPNNFVNCSISSLDSAILTITVIVVDNKLSFLYV